MRTLQPETKIAVIGGGVAGITACHMLDDRAKVTLYEKNNYVGGHTHSVAIPSGADAGTKVDTGFIVLNDRTYPNLHKLLKRLGVGVRYTDMSFGYWDRTTNFQYSGNGLGGLLAQPANIANPRLWRLTKDFLRFNALGKRLLLEKAPLDMPLGQFLALHGFSDTFRDDYLVPMGASIWSTSNEEMLDFPTIVFLEFFRNHGMLTVDDRPRWQTVEGSSSAYVDAFLQHFSGVVRKDARIKRILRSETGVRIEHENGTAEDYDMVVFAVHADQVLPLLGDASDKEKRLFSPWAYQENHTILHSDATVLPPAKRAWASWNFCREHSDRQRNPVSIAYDMTRLQGLQAKEHYLVSLNRVTPIPQDKIVREFLYHHPTFTLPSVASRPGIRAMQGERNTFFVGSYFGNGFHEDAVKSSVDMLSSQFGLAL